MDFVKIEDQNAIDEESYKIYLENLQKYQPTDPTDYQHTQLSVEQLHQVMQSSLNANQLSHNFQLSLSPRQMSTLMLKTNHLARNLNFNDIPAHLQRNLAHDIDLVHNLANEIPHNLGREDLIVSRNLDFNFARTLANEMDFQNTLTHSLVQNLNEQELVRTLNSELSQNLHRINDSHLLQNIRDSNLVQNLNQELDLTHHLNRHNLEQELLNQESRRTSIEIVNGQILDQRLDQNMQRLDLRSELLNRSDQNLIQRLANTINLNEATQRQLEQSSVPMPFVIKSEQDDDGYFYDSVNQGINESNSLNSHIPVSADHNQATNMHQDSQLYYNQIPNVPALSTPELTYPRPQFVQNFIRDNPQNLVMHKQFENFPGEDFKKVTRQDIEAKVAKPEPPKENLKPADQNKIFFNGFSHSNSQNYSTAEKNENDASAHNKIETSESVTMSIKGEYVCYKCNEVFSAKRALKQHAKNCIEQNEDNAESFRKFKCPQCSYSCHSQAILKIHERTHTGEKPFSCTFCDYKSGQKNNVAKHILVHMKAKPFRCQYCDYCCAQKNNLVVHERTHTGYKPFACPHCDYRTVQKPNLVKHMYLHTDQKPFRCDLCSYRCVQKTNLTKHRQKHLNEKTGEKIEGKLDSKPYKPRQKSLKCLLCSYRCVQKSSLDKHLQFKHGDQDEFPNENLEQQGLNLIRNELSDEMMQNLKLTLDKSLKEDNEVYPERNIEHGLNLIQEEVNVIQNLSVKKDGHMFAENLCEVKVAEPLQVES